MQEGVLARDNDKAGCVVFFWAFEGDQPVCRDDVNLDDYGQWDATLSCPCNVIEWTQEEWLEDYLKKDLPRPGAAVEVLLE